MTTVPTPRFDLLEDESLRLRQPPVLPRLPVPVRVLRHHRHLRPPAPDQDRRAGHRRARGDAPARACRIAFIVDDNLIGNKKAIKAVLREVDRLAEAEGLSADLLHRGVDRPGRRPRADGADGRSQHHHRRSSASRAPTRSRSARPRSSRTSAQGGTLLEKVHAIQEAGHGGLVRHDHRLRQRRRDDLRRVRSSSSSRARIAFSMSGMLHAIPKTPLYDRLPPRGGST